MARPSNRDRIVESAILLAERQGIRGITIEAVAQVAGMSKGGVQYHFSSKEEMMDAVVTDIWQRSEEDAQRHLTGPFDESNLAQRLEAYIRSTIGTETGAGELVIFLEGSRIDGMNAKLRDFQKRWTSAPGEDLTAQQRLAILAADGIWMNDVSGFLDFSPSQRQDLLRELINMTQTKLASRFP